MCADVLSASLPFAHCARDQVNINKSNNNNNNDINNNFDNDVLETRSILFVYDINNISETGLTTLAGDDGVRNIALVAKDESAEKIQRELSSQPCH